MISALISTPPPAQSANPGAAAAAAKGKGFSSVLKSSVQKTEDASGTDSTAPVQENSSNNTAPAKNKQVTKNAPVMDAANTNPPAAGEKDAQQEANAADTSNNMLMQLVLQMRAAGQQVTENPAGKEVPAEAPGLMIAQVAQALHKDGETAETAPLMQNTENPAADSETDNAPDFLTQLAGETASAPVKATDNLKSAVINARVKDDTLNSATTSDAAKSESAANPLDLASKNAAFGLKTASTASASDNLAQWKMDASAAQPSLHVEDKSSSPDIKNLTGIYAQMSQTQPSASHAPSAQETVPVNRISSMDEIISKAVDSGQKNLVIKIDPPDLGSVQIKLSYDNGVLRADVRVDSSAVKDSFNLALPQIKTSLENSGIKISEFNVDVREDQYRDEQHSNNQGQQQQRQSRETKSGFFDFFA